MHFCICHITFSPKMEYTLHIRIIEGLIISDKDYDNVFCHFTHNKINYQTATFYQESEYKTDGKWEEEFDLAVEDNTKGSIEFFLANRTKFSEKDLAHLKIDFSSLNLGEKVEKMWNMKACPEALKVDYGRAKMILLMTKNKADDSGQAQSSERLNSLIEENRQLRNKSVDMEKKINRLEEENKDFIRKQSSPSLHSYNSNSFRRSDDSDSSQHSDDSDSPPNIRNIDDYDSYIHSVGSESYKRSRGSESYKRDDESQNESDESLQKNNDRVKRENDDVTQINERLKSENETIQSENESIQKDFDQLEKDNEKLRNEIKELGEKVKSLEGENDELAKIKKDADKKMSDRIKELEETNEQLSTLNTKLQGKGDYLNDENKLLMKHVHNIVSVALKAKENFNIKNDKE